MQIKELCGKFSMECCHPSWHPRQKIKSIAQAASTGKLMRHDSVCSISKQEREFN